MAKLLGIDIGTSGCKVLLVDEHGRILRQASAEYPISVPRPMWSEQNPEHWWAGVERCLHEIGESNPDAVGVTGQMHGAVFLDGSDRVIRPAILWNDQRTVAQCEEIDRVVGPELVRQTTCNPPLTGFQLPKLLWLREFEPEAFDRVRSLLLPKDFIRWKLTGVKATEVSDASGTGIFDVPKRRWSQELMGVLDLPAQIFPECFESSVVSAKTAFGGFLAEGIPVVGGGGDQAAAAVGTGAVVPGIVSVSLGTSGVVFTSQDSPNYDRNGAAHTFCHANGQWHTMGVMLSCGGALRWFRDTCYTDHPFEAIASDAASVEPGSEGLIFLPYLTGERCPYNDPLARSAFAGLTLGHSRAHMARAVFEGVTCGLAECAGLLEAMGSAASEVRLNGGGAQSLFWTQMLADMLQTPCTTLEVDEGPAFGAALLAGVGVGVYPSVVEACQSVIRREREIVPLNQDYSGVAKRYKDLYLATRAWNTNISS